MEQTELFVGGTRKARRSLLEGVALWPAPLVPHRRRPRADPPRRGRPSGACRPARTSAQDLGDRAVRRLRRLRVDGRKWRRAATRPPGGRRVLTDRLRIVRGRSRAASVPGPGARRALALVSTGLLNIARGLQRNAPWWRARRPGGVGRAVPGRARGCGSAARSTGAPAGPGRELRSRGGGSTCFSASRGSGGRGRPSRALAREMESRSRDEPRAAQPGGPPQRDALALTVEGQEPGSSPPRGRPAACSWPWPWPRSRSIARTRTSAWRCRRPGFRAGRGAGGGAVPRGGATRAALVTTAHPDWARRLAPCPSTRWRRDTPGAERGATGAMSDDQIRRGARGLRRGGHPRAGGPGGGALAPPP